MASNSVNANNGGDRIMVAKFTAAHLAGDLVFEQGWFGIVEDDVAAGDLGYIICKGTWLLGRVPATVAAGTKLYALPTAVATTLALQSTTAGTHFAVGRTAATGGASYAKVVLFHTNSDY